MSNSVSILNSIDSNIKKGKTRLAIDELLNLTKDIREDIYNDLLVISNRYSRNVNQFDAGLITQEDSNSTENRIVKSVINAKNDIEQSITGVIVPSNRLLTINSILNKNEKSNNLFSKLYYFIADYFNNLFHKNKIKIVDEKFYNTALSFSSNSHQESITQKINIFINDDIKKLNNRNSEKIKLEIAKILQVEIDSIQIRKVNSGSIIFEFELPFIYAQKFKLIYESTDKMKLDDFEVDDFKAIKPFKIEFSKLNDDKIVNLFFQEKDLLYFYNIRERYNTKVYRKCQSILEDESLSEDITNEIFIILFLTLDRYKNKFRFSTFVYKTIYRYLIYVTGIKLDKKLLYKKYEIELSFDFDVDNFLIEVYTQNVIDLLNELDLLEKIILLMKYQDCLSVKEICNILTLDESTVKLMIKFAKDKIRFLYKEKYYT